MPGIVRRGSAGMDVPIVIELLDQIPLPIMLQTATGRVLVRNEAWYRHLLELQNPVLIQQAAASLLEMEPGMEPTESTVRSARRMDPSRVKEEQDGRIQEQMTNPAEQERGFCYLGSDTNTCLCVCPTHDGQEKVWQFTKILVQLGAALGTEAASWLGTSPEETLWLLLAQDRTEQHRVTAELAARNADLMQLNRLKDEFLACISHELKTPLTAILGLSSLLKELVMGDLNDRQFRYVQLIHQSGRHLVSIVNDMLDLTRMETGQLELVLEPVNIHAICETAYHHAKTQHLHGDDSPSAYPSSQASQDVAAPTESEPLFTLEIEPGLDYIMADALRLRQMLVHLLSNALKFTEGQQELGLIVNRWEGWIAFTVWDTGIGIPADKQHLIFQKFQQLESPLTRRFEGTGLGLVLTQRLARLHGGDVTFISKEGEGSQFTLLLPPTPPLPAQTPGTTLAHQERLSGTSSGYGTTQGYSSNLEEPPQHTVQHRLSNRLVLLVESSVSIIEDATTQITNLGYRVAIARSGTEALEKARRLQPCLIFLNPSLPLLSGWDVLTLLKSYADTRTIPVVMMANVAEKTHTPLNQADDVLSLPIQSEQLQHVLLSRANSHGETASTLPTVQGLTVMLLNLTNTNLETDGYLWDRPDDRTIETVENNQLAPVSLADITQLLQAHRHRLLEVDDLDQADLLARVWKPDVVLLSDSSPELAANMQRLSSYDYLASLPIVTLTPAVTEAANRVGGLSVFPCLTSPTVALRTAPGQPEVSALLQVIQAAAGMNWTPRILMVDILHLPDLAICMNPGDHLTQLHVNTNTRHTKIASTNWLQALSRYLQTAGFQGIVGQSWAEVLHHLQQQSIDLLVFYLKGGVPLHYSDATIPIENALAELHNLPALPPIIAIDHCYRSNFEQSSSLASSPPMSTGCLPEALEEYIRSLALHVLPAATSMTTLVDVIRNILSP